MFMREVKKLDYISFALVEGVVTALINLIIGILFTIVGGTFLGASGLGALVLATTGFLMIIIMPIVGFIVGFIGGIIIALIYNFLINKYIKIKVE